MHVANIKPAPFFFIFLFFVLTENLNESSGTIAKINLANLAHNFLAIKKLVGRTKIMAMVKADAYGHGMIPIAQRLITSGVDYLGVAFVEEGIALRQAGVLTPVLVTGGILGKQFANFLDYNLEITLSSVYKLAELESVCQQKNKIAQVHLKIDTGMERIGIHSENASQLIDRAINSKWIEIKGVYSHFACADQVGSNFTKLQLEKFLNVVDYFKKQNYRSPVLMHLANSAALDTCPESFLDLVRPGIFLYGCYPENHFQSSLELRPVLSLETKVVYFKVIPANTGVSYSHSWKSTKQTRIVTLPIGYGHGYSRALANRADVLIHGKRCQLVGNICMDQLMVDLGDHQAYVDDSVVLIGQDGDQRITVEKLAELSGTISYEILTNLKSRIPRIYQE